MASHVAVGNKIGRYEILAELGKGAMGQVYLAQDQKLERRVAVKILPSDMASSPDRIQRFVREAKASAALNHPNIAHIYESGESEGVSFIAMEFIDGDTLRHQFSLRRMKIADVLDIGSQIASALSAAHERGIIHRDLKPENVMRTRAGVIKVLDFGLAKLLDTPAIDIDREATTKSMSLTEPGTLLGTMAYMSPEQVRVLPLDQRSDLFSLGVIIYEMIAGAAPFRGDTPGDVIAAILEKEPAPLTSFTKEISAQVEFVVMKALRKDREERYQTARDLLTDLKLLKHKLDFQAELQRNPRELGLFDALQDGSRPQEAASLSFPSDGQKSKGQPEHIRPLLELFVERVQELEGRASILTGLETGFDVDRLTAGFQTSHLITVVSPPRIGASTLCVNIARNGAVLNKTTVLFFSLQRSKDDILTRFICSHASVDIDRWRSGFLTRKEWAFVAKALGELGELGIVIDDSSELSLDEIKSRVATLSKTAQVGLVLIDNLQLVSDLWSDSQSAAKKYGHAARALKALAVQFNLVVLVVFRASAAFDITNATQNSLPDLLDYTQIRSVEDVSDVVILLCPDEEQEKDDSPVRIDLTVIKNRNGPSGTVQLIYKPSLALFENAPFTLEPD